MTRKIAFTLPVLMALLVSCAGHEALTRHSEEKLAAGEPWRAWSLAVKALDKAPGNPRARAAATAAADAIGSEWQRKIHAFAQTDSLAAAEQVLDFVTFRSGAARYCTVPLPAGWPAEETALLASGARIEREHAKDALDAKRPKKAYLHLLQAERFAPDDPAIGKLADHTYRKALTRVAFVPLRAGSGAPPIGRDVAAAWSGELAKRVSPPEAQFTRILSVEDVERRLRVSELDHITREEAIRVAAAAGADRVVWGTIGDVESKSGLHIFSDVVARRVVQKNASGQRETHWLNVPIKVVARVREVTADVSYEIVDTRTGAILAHENTRCSQRGRVLWTTYVPQGDPATYALVSDPARAANPRHAKEVESRWESVVGAGTSLAQVLTARRNSRGAAPDRGEIRARLLAGAAFVFLQELPSTEDLAYAAVAGHWGPIQRDLLRLDSADDVDLQLTVGDAADR